MPSAADARVPSIDSMRVLVAIVLGTVLLPAYVSAGQANRSGAEQPGAAEIARALEAIRADPNLATERTIKTLQWKDRTKPKPSRPPGWFAWIAEFFRWIERSARLLVWGAAILLAAFLAVYLVRITAKYRGPVSDVGFAAPTHVRDLDIRPETLPHDIGAAARALWDRGEHRAALALLYRGLLSRLAHVHHVPIRDSSTEGDCLALAASHLPPARCEYAARLVRVWQRAVYGREDIQVAAVYGLCDDFAAALNAAGTLDPAVSGGTS